MEDDIWKEYRLAVAEYLDADQNHSIASNTRTAKLNQLNACQKKINEHIAKLKMDAPIYSDWKRTTGNG